jgi:hypothetical protein
MATSAQSGNWAFGDDDGSESGHTLHTEGVNDTGIAIDTPFTIRLQPQETGGGTFNTGYALFAQKNGTGGYTEVTRTRTDGLQIVANGSSRTDDEATSSRLTAGSGSWVAGKFDDGATQGTTSVSLSSQYTDIEFCIQVTTGAATNDYWDLRLHESGGSALDSYGTLPRATAGTIVQSLTIADVSHTHSLEACNAAPPATPLTHDIDAETGDMTEWDATYGTQMTATSGSAIHGSYGFNVDVTGTSSHSGETQHNLSGKTDYRWRFYIDTTGLTMDDADSFWLLWGRKNTTNELRCQLQFGHLSGGHEIRMGIKNDAETTFNSSYYSIDSGEYWVEGHVFKASSSVAADGGFSLWINGSLKETQSDIDNYDTFEDLGHTRWGMATSNNTLTTGSFYLDDLIFRTDDTEIGEIGGTPTLTVADVAHTHAAESIGTLAVHNPLTLADIAHTHALEAFILAYNANLTLADVAHTNAIESFALQYAASIVAQELAHSHALDAFTIVYHAILTNQDIAHTHSTEAPALSFEGVGSLVIQDVAHTNALEAPTVIYDGQAAAAAIQHDHTLEAVTLTYSALLQVPDVSHTHAVEAMGLAYHGNLTVADVAHTNVVEDASVTYGGVLSNVADPWHQHTLEAPTLTFSTEQTIQVADLAHVHDLDYVAIDYTAVPQVSDLSHVHALDASNVVFNGQEFTLSTDDVIHLNGVESTVLAFSATLAIADISHTHNVDGMRFGGVVVSYMHDHDDFLMLML